MRVGQIRTIKLGGRPTDYRLVTSKSARKLRLRVGPSGVEVVSPRDRTLRDVEQFLRANTQWTLGQLDRVDKLRSVRRAPNSPQGTMLYRGSAIQVSIERSGRRAPSTITTNRASLIIHQGITTTTSAAQTLEKWLRKQARTQIWKEIDAVGKKLKLFPHKVYVRGQRTKWGNCSKRKNLSFNWRLILAPDFVLRYLVTHEMVHLAVPQHSSRFWLTVQSLCPDAQKAKRWLSANSDNLFFDLEVVCCQRNDSKLFLQERKRV